ncbi:MAG: peptidoglycan-binding protein [Solirubrobacteraceae bacterium]
MSAPTATTEARLPSEPYPDPRPPRRGRALLTGGAVLAIAVVVIAVLDPLSSGESGTSVASARPAATATIAQGPLSSQVYQNGTLGYAARADGSPYSVIDQAAGTLTRLPVAGDVIGCGEVLYRVENVPVALLCGRTPAYRALSEGMSGPDVRQLNRNLVDLGYAKRSTLDRDSSFFGSRTANALARLQEDLGVAETGALEPGQAVFLPGPLRITKVTAAPGTGARPGAPIAQATTTERSVEVDLDASQATGVEVGDRVQITLPDNETTPGVVTSVGTVAGSADEDEGSGSGAEAPSATIPVSIELERPRDVRGLEQAPVRVQITTDGVKDALSVPVTALVALAGGGYAVELVAGNGARTLVPVELGMFDHAEGVVQVSGDGIAAGQRVVVPAT